MEQQKNTILIEVFDENNDKKLSYRLEPKTFFNFTLRNIIISDLGHAATLNIQAINRSSILFILPNHDAPEIQLKDNCLQIRYPHLSAVKQSTISVAVKCQEQISIIKLTKI